MKVLLNVSSLGPTQSGIGTYTFHLHQGLLNHGHIDALSVFGKRAEKAGAPRLLSNLARTAVRPFPVAYEMRDRVTARLLRRLKMARSGYLYHEPNYVAVPYDGPSVVTVSDLSHLHCPEFHPKGRVRWLTRNLVRSVTQAQQVICHSEFIRREVIEELGVPGDKVTVVYHGADAKFQPRSAEESRRALTRFGLADTPYVLSVGTMEPRKNLAGLIQAFGSLPKALRVAHPLVVVGPRGWMSRPIEAAMAPLKREGTIRWLGYVSIDDLAHLYSGAHAFAYLSFYEGFGLPVIEALSSGAPVLTSNCSALPEITAGAALLVDPNDPHQIAAELQRLLQDDELRRDYASKGLERARLFRWETCIDNTVAVYEKIQAGL